MVKRKAGSGFVGSEEPSLVKVPEGKTYEFDTIKDSDGNWMVNEGGEATPCLMGCGDIECREWANLEIMNGLHKGDFMYHISECQMEDCASRLCRICGSSHILLFFAGVALLVIGSGGGAFLVWVIGRILGIFR